ncbi:ABC transporter substrate-binding protein [Frankia sp. AgB32]|uniref:ABC transporter substrate-binding protein n=1 Tax=Frankia sp. AgB32 TaxID=631119 RepID=UPI0020102A15|nr:ABC transporter substrate-binding protein [Frankia sp. AgB32]MCK9894168.1 transporter substrate-binding domain-containing protein [Frankia sp. AgB32]
MPHPRRLAWLALLTTAMFALASCAGSSGGGGSTGGLRLVKAGELTIATDSPAYPPWFADGKPANGKGFEGALAYAIAARLGFGADKLHWVTEPFASSFAPGAKNFDFDINQISITPERAQAVDFSTGYYDVTQAVVALKTSRIADVTTLRGLKDAKLGAPVGTTSLDAITRNVAPVQEPAVFNDVNDAKTALENGPIDGIVVDLPTAFQLTSSDIDNSFIVGQFPSTGTPEQFGMLFEKGNPLVAKVNDALAQLKASGELKQITDQWLGSQAGAPVLR